MCPRPETLRPKERPPTPVLANARHHLGASLTRNAARFGATLTWSVAVTGARDTAQAVRHL